VIDANGRRKHIVPTALSGIRGLLVLHSVICCGRVTNMAVFLTDCAIFLSLAGLNVVSGVMFAHQYILL
jgi:hypothetical protein